MEEPDQADFPQEKQRPWDSTCPAGLLGPASVSAWLSTDHRVGLLPLPPAPGGVLSLTGPQRGGTGRLVSTQPLFLPLPACHSRL